MPGRIACLPAAGVARTSAAVLIFAKNWPVCCVESIFSCEIDRHIQEYIKMEAVAGLA